LTPAPKSGRASRPARARAKSTGGGAKKADAAAKRAKDAGATGPRLPAARQALRDSMIIARAAQGMPYAVIAAEAKVSVRQVERIVAGNRGVRSPLEDTPMELLDELAVGYRLAIGDFEAMALAWFDTNQSASLGAKKAADESRARLATLLEVVGKLPENMELFRSEAQMQRIAETMAQTMRAVADGEMDAGAAVDVFEELIGRKPARVIGITERAG